MVDPTRHGCRAENDEGHVQDRRGNLRKKTFLGGRMVFNHRQSTMDCIVKNMGQNGARLEFTNAASVPDEFDVRVERMERTFRARVAWRGKDALGVSFLGFQSPNVVPLDMAVRIRRLEAEKAELQLRVAQLSSGA